MHAIVGVVSVLLIGLTPAQGAGLTKSQDDCAGLYASGFTDDVDHDFAVCPDENGNVSLTPNVSKDVNGMPEIDDLFKGDDYAACRDIFNKRPFSTAMKAIGKGLPPGGTAGELTQRVMLSLLERTRWRWEYFEPEQTPDGDTIYACTDLGAANSSSVIHLYKTICKADALYLNEIARLNLGSRFYLVATHELGHVIDNSAGPLPFASDRETRATTYGAVIAQCHTRVWQRLLRDLGTDPHLVRADVSEEKRRRSELRCIEKKWVMAESELEDMWRHPNASASVSSSIRAAAACAARVGSHIRAPQLDHCPVRPLSPREVTPLPQAGSAGSQAPCSDAVAARARIVHDNQLLPIVDGTDLALMSFCDPDGPKLVALLDATLLDHSYAPVPTVARIAADRNVHYEPPPCTRGSGCEFFVRIAELPPGLRSVVAADPRITQSVPASSGGAPNIPDHYFLSLFARHSSSKVGHYQITRSGTQTYGPDYSDAFSNAAIELMQDASRDADFFEWKHPQAHAQSPNGNDGLLSGTQVKAKADYIQWERDVLRKIDDLCASNEVRSALYWTGYALHGIQDLAFHRGISNAEHAWRDYGRAVTGEHGVDTSFLFNDKKALAEYGTKEFLRRLRGRLTGRNEIDCWNRMRQSSPRPLTASEKKTLHGGEPDISLDELLRYHHLAEVVDAAGAGQGSVLINPQWVTLTSNEVDRASLAPFLDEIFNP